MSSHETPPSAALNGGLHILKRKYSGKAMGYLKVPATEQAMAPSDGTDERNLTE
jgi:hypothetical protein